MTPPDLVAAARAVAFTARRLERCLGDMTLPQFRVLALVASSPERANRIAELAAVSRPSLTGLLDGLEARGWVRRANVAGDRRGVMLEVTPEGGRALAAAEAALAAALDQALGEAAPADRRQAVDGLAALGRALRATRAPARPAATPHADHARRTGGTAATRDPGRTAETPGTRRTAAPSAAGTAARTAAGTAAGTGGNPTPGPATGPSGAR